MKRFAILIFLCLFFSFPSSPAGIRELDSIARVAFEEGEYPRSAECYAEILRKLPKGRLFDADRIAYARQYSRSQLLAGGYKETEELLKDSLFKNDIPLQINLAASLGYQERNDEALEIFDRLLLENHLTEALKGTILQNKGFILMEERRFDEAESYLKEALNYLEGESRVITLSNLALSLARNKKFKKAHSVMNEALNGFRKSEKSGRKDYIRALRKLAEIYYLEGKLADANKIFRQYFNLEKEWLFDNLPTLSKTQKLNLWLSEKPLLSKCFMLEKENPDFLYEVALFRRLTSLLGMNDEDELERWLKMNVGDVRKGLPPKSAAIEFISYPDTDGNEKYGALLLSPSGKAKFVALFNSDFLYRPEVVGTNSIFNAVKRDSQQDKDALYSDIDLGNLVWSPIISELPPGTSDIFFAPEGIFHLWGIENMPFHGKEGLRLHRVTSTADISNRNLGIKDSTSMLLIGGLNYSAIPSEGESAERNHLAGETLKRKVGTTNVFKFLPATRSEVDSINNSFCNATIIYHAPEGELKRMMPEFKTVHIATHGYSLNLGIRKRPEYLADSLAYDSSLQACALALTGANHLFETGQREDGLLSAREICDLDLSNVDFVILSACQTAQGNVTDEGAAGLVRGLKNAGVKTVMATLWPVDDRSTMIFMNKFYDLLHQGRSKYEAFVGAQDYLKGYEKRVPLRKFSPSTLAHEQNSVFNSVKYDSPYYWAPFIIIDD